MGEIQGGMCERDTDISQITSEEKKIIDREVNFMDSIIARKNPDITYTINQDSSIGNILTIQLQNHRNNDRGKIKIERCALEGINLFIQYALRGEELLVISEDYLFGHTSRAEVNSILTDMGLI